MVWMGLPLNKTDQEFQALVYVTGRFVFVFCPLLLEN
jgi:hypothetical protein